jgi:hypothetical protein
MKRRRAAFCRRAEQRRLEPSSRLLDRFHVRVRRPSQLAASGQHCRLRASRIEPDVEHVLLALEIGAAALLAAIVCAREIRKRPREPRIGAFARKDLLRPLHHRDIE